MELPVRYLKPDWGASETFFRETLAREITQVVECRDGALRGEILLEKIFTEGGGASYGKVKRRLTRRSPSIYFTF